MIPLRMIREWFSDLLITLQMTKGISLTVLRFPK